MIQVHQAQDIQQANLILHYLAQHIEQKIK